MNEKTVRKILPEEMALPEQVRATAYHQRRAPTPPKRTSRPRTGAVGNGDALRPGAS